MSSSARPPGSEPSDNPRTKRYQRLYGCPKIYAATFWNAYKRVLSDAWAERRGDRPGTVRKAGIAKLRVNPCRVTLCATI